MFDGIYEEKSKDEIVDGIEW